MISWLLAGCISVTLPGRPHAGPLPEPEPALLASAQRVADHVEVLAGDIGPRSLAGDADALRQASRYIEDAWRAQGYAVERQPVETRLGTADNLIVRLPGGPESVVVGAHYDTWVETPGADDNATGVAALLELSRALAGRSGERTVTFVAWTNEEPPFFDSDDMGSRVHALSDDSVVAALSLEMLGVYDSTRGSQHYPFPLGLLYPRTGDFVAVVGNVRSRRLARDVGRRFRETEPFPSRGGTAPGWIRGLDWSDHASYWDQGVPAVMITDTSLFRYAHYHEPTDTPDRVDPVAVARVSRGLVGVVSELAGLDLDVPVDVAGVEGFFAPEVVEGRGWLEDHGIATGRGTLRSVRDRTVKLVLDGGTREDDEAVLTAREAVACTDEARSWNTAACAGLAERVCTDGRCTYGHFGNCSGFLVGDGQLITAAHCLVGVDLQTSYGLDGEGRRLPLADPVALKTEFDHDWVGVDEAEPVDVAWLSVDDRGLSPWPVAPVPPVGAPVFIHGFPRVVGRSDAAREAHGYPLLQGTPAYSFGRVVDDNARGVPLCSTDGSQEGWRLAADCPVAEVTVEGQPGWTGPLTMGPFLGSWDTCNGYSGAPVFDARARLVGVNSTLVSPHSPQERYSPEMKTVATPVAGLPGGAATAPGPRSPAAGSPRPGR